MTTFVQYRIFIYLFLLITTTIFSCSTSNTKHEKEDGYLLAIRRDAKITQDPATGLVPKERLLIAKAYKDRQLKTRAAISNVNWNELGPNNCGGRTRSMLVDLNDATRKTVWAGGVDGGIWKTTDITASNVQWNHINDFFDNLAVSCMAQDPSNPQIMYFGTGEGYGNADRVRGLGIWKTIDGGATWNQLSATNNATFYYCMKMVVTNSGSLLVATADNGLRLSINGGTSFTKVLGSGLSITGAANNRAYDVELAANGDIYASLGGSIHKSTNGGSTFAAAQTLGVTCNRIELACAQSNSSVVYALVENGGQVAGILSTNDGGTSWTPKTEPVDADGGISATDFSRGQAWYDLAIAVSPVNDQLLYVGGIDLFKSINGGTNWSQVSHWYGGFSFQDVHADQHHIIFSPGSADTAYFVNDGGIYRTDNSTASMPTILSKEKNYITSQFYSCAIHPTTGNNYFLGGTQDNGSHKLTSDIISSSVEVTGGDGAFCHIDQDQPLFQFTSYVYNEFYRSTNGGLSWTNISTSGGDFISPTDYDNVNNKLYMCDANSTYRRWDNPQTGSTFVQVSVPSFGGLVSAVTCSPNTANRVFFGIENGDVFMLDNAHTASPTVTNISTGLPTGNVSCIEVETGNDNHILACYSNYGVNSVWESINGGVNWTSVEGNLPDMPVRWILLNPNNNDQALIATELGVWSTDNLNGTSTVWGASNTGLANVRVDMLQTRASDKLVIAATHGRGMFFSDIFTSPTAKFTSNTQIGYINKAIQFTNTSYQSTTYAWDFGDGTTSTQENPLKAYTTAGIFNVTLTINTGASSITKTNYIQILPNKTPPYTIAQGGNFETNVNDFGAYSLNGTPFVRGNSAVSGKSGNVSASNAWVTGLTGNYLNNTTSYLYTPNYNFSASGYYSLRFFTKYNLENQYDGFTVQYTLDSGDTWQELSSAVQTNWYNFSNNPLVSGVFPFNQAFFTGNAASSFTQKTKDISQFAGTTSVAFRFQFLTDDNSVSAGVAIDNFEILGPLTFPLPVTLTTFSARPFNENDIEVNWETENEMDILSYEVERSKDGKVFLPIQQKNALNLNNNTYTILDKNAWMIANTNTLYYRLAILESNGKKSYSDIRVVTNNSTVRDIILSPNPCKNILHINTTASLKSIAILDLQGKALLSLKKPSNTINLPTSMSNGTYFVKIETSTGVVLKKFIKE